MKAGAVMNIVALFVLWAVMETIGVAVFDLHANTLPAWVLNGRNLTIISRPTNKSWTQAYKKM